MPGGKFDSSKTRVAPVFDALAKQEGNWVRRLLQLAKSPSGVLSRIAESDLTFLRGHWGSQELGLNPPVSLLSWLVRHPKALRSIDTSNGKRRALFAGEPVAVQEALARLRTKGPDRAWYILEGKTFPDAVIETPDSLIVIEGKRSEAGPTIDTTWLQGRHQIWRHIDAAWEIRGRRAVYGMFLVEGSESGDLAPNSVWMNAVRNSLADHTLDSGFPHRSSVERDAISKCLIGVTTWQQVLKEFDLPSNKLVDEVGA